LQAPAVQCRTALVVDDEPSVRSSTARLLRRVGLEVLEAASAEEALAYGREGRTVHVMLTDVVMPDISGIELAQTARELWPDAGILLFSAFTPAALTRHKLYDDRDMRILQKPLERADLLAAIAAALAR
jgi:CheY-like chemotaxis protein